MKKFKSLNFYQIFFCDFQQISMSLVKIGKIREKKIGKNLVIWIFSLNSKKQGL